MTSVLPFNKNHRPLTRRERSEDFHQVTVVQLADGSKAYEGLAVCGRTPDMGEFILIAPDVAGCDRIWEHLMAVDRTVVRVDVELAQPVLVLSKKAACVEPVDASADPSHD